MYIEEAIELLKDLISTPSFSREEDQTANLIEQFFQDRGIIPKRLKNNIWVTSKYWQQDQPVVLLNSHHDTVKPVSGWTKDPFNPEVDGDILYGLGSNDAGASLVALIATFLQFYEKRNTPFNLIIAATAEEEISGTNGIASILSAIGPIDMGIVGEPTKLEMAIAEKGLMVIDAEAIGKAGHAAREEGENALYKAIEDINWIKQHQFEKTSALLGPVKMTVTQIEAGHQHNVVPDCCKFVIDIRTNEAYSNQEVFHFLEEQLQSNLRARSFRLNSSGIPLTHPLVMSGQSLGLHHFGSPTLSDQALLSFPTIKLGCGDSARSHTANEFIKLSEIKQGFQTYTQILERIKL